MKEFLNTYADVLQTNHEQVGQVHIDFKRQCVDMTVEKLLEQFVQSKYTGFERPGKRIESTGAYALREEGGLFVFVRTLISVHFYLVN